MSNSYTEETDRMDMTKMADDVDERNSHPIRLSKSHNLTKQSSTMSHAKSEELLHETKYVMLNFMSLIPPHLYKNHVYPSPDVTKSSSGYNKFSKSLSSLGKSKSFDIAPLRSQKQNHLSRLHMLERELGSPASEDNVSYRYKQNQTALGENTSAPCAAKSASDNQQDTSSNQVSKSHSTHSVDAVTSSDISPQKTPRFMHRMTSDTSSCGDYSYFSDADDEYEMSHSSSMFSAASSNQQDVFLDLRKSSCSSKLVIGRSISELDDVDPGKLLSSEVIPESQDEENEDKKQNRQSSYIVSVENVNRDNCNELDEADGLVQYMPGGQHGDRTKLKLKIPPQPVVLDDVLLSLQSELNYELSEMESEFEEAVNCARESAQPMPSMTTTQAAKILARIGDEVKEEYSNQISSTVSQLLFYRVSELTYQQFKDISAVMIDNRLPGWRQVALLMVYGQSAAWSAIQDGHKNISNIFDHCARLVFDVAAEFIIKEGGWGAVMNFDPSQSSDTQSSAEFESPVVEYFTKSNMMQLVSETTKHSDNKMPEDVANHSMHAGDSAFHMSNLCIPQLDIDPLSGPDITEEEISKNSHKFLHTEMSQTYKPSLGFDFRSKSSSTEDSLNCDPNSNDSLDCVLNGNDSGLHEDIIKTFDSESNEGEVFHDQNANFSENAMTDGTIVDMIGGDLEIDNMKKDIEHFDDSLTAINFVSLRNDSQEIVQQAGFMTELNANSENNTGKICVAVSNTYRKSLGKEKNDELKSDFKENEIQETERQIESEIYCDSINVNKFMTEKSSDKNQNTGNNERKCNPLTGYLGGTGTKVMLLMGAAAMVLGLKFRFFNR